MDENWGFYQLEKLKMLQKKYLGSKKYLKDLRRCKIKFRTTFVFYTMLIFQLLFELLSFKIICKIFLTQIFSEIFKALQLKKEWKNQHGTENKSCLEFDFTSSKVPQIFFESQIFLPWQFQIFECIFLKKDDFSDLTDNGFCQALVQRPIWH